MSHEGLDGEQDNTRTGESSHHVCCSILVQANNRGKFWAVMGNIFCVHVDGCKVCEFDNTKNTRNTESYFESLSETVNEEKFPMLCISMDSFLHMDRILSFGELEKRGLLIAPKGHMMVHLISHEWLSYTHPDPSSVQLQRMQEVFRQIIDGRGRSLFVEEDWISFSEGSSATWTKNTRNLEGSAQQDKVSDESFAEYVQNGVVWMDFLSVPQLVDVSDERDETFAEHERKQELAIQSIPAYVERTNVFWVLAPDAVHENRQEPCGFTTWSGRGWCRLEEWANFLSRRALMPLVITDSPKIATYTRLSFMLDNLSKPERAVCRGSFSCCSMNHMTQVGRFPRRIPCDKKQIVQAVHVHFFVKRWEYAPVANNNQNDPAGGAPVLCPRALRPHSLNFDTALALEWAVAHLFSRHCFLPLCTHGNERAKSSGAQQDVQCEGFARV